MLVKKPLMPGCRLTPDSLEWVEFCQRNGAGRFDANLSVFHSELFGFAPVAVLEGSLFGWIEGALALQIDRMICARSVVAIRLLSGRPMLSLVK